MDKRSENFVRDCCEVVEFDLRELNLLRIHFEGKGYRKTVKQLQGYIDGALEGKQDKILVEKEPGMEDLKGLVAVLQDNEKLKTIKQRTQCGGKERG